MPAVLETYAFILHTNAFVLIWNNLSLEFQLKLHFHLDLIRVV